ncbi:MAG: deoxyribodipyrimidine photo-lyase [Firmicutes bacterium]|nr:deoxyribodipyrimidine photo-lyase [Bacillota bacterium]
MMFTERIKFLNELPIIDNLYIIYWMVNAQRCDYNHSLEYAISMSNKYKKPLIVFIGAKIDYQFKRQKDFMLEGLIDVKADLGTRGIELMVGDCSGASGIYKLSEFACLIVTDKAYIKEEIVERDLVREKVNCLFVEVESNLMVPVESASLKEEYSAATIRKKIWNEINLLNYDFMKEEVLFPSIDIIEEVSFKVINIDQKLIGDTIKKFDMVGGSNEARRKLEYFIEEKLKNYSRRNYPSEDWTSGLSPYLHFGQISPIEIYKAVSNCDETNIAGFLEELIVRRELAFNFIYNNKNYDNYSCLPNWAITTLEKHSEDIREYLYDLSDLEAGKTHDDYWNSAQKELVRSGVMHNYMRMYWGKKIIEWSATPKEAFKRAIYLNNKYALDGFDPNSYTGIAWCFGKHDRPWREREIFGMVRFMNDKGLKRKFDMNGYLDKWK